MFFSVTIVALLFAVKNDLLCTSAVFNNVSVDSNAVVQDLQIYVIDCSVTEKINISAIVRAALDGGETSRSLREKFRVSFNALTICKSPSAVVRWLVSSIENNNKSASSSSSFSWCEDDVARLVVGPENELDVFKATAYVAAVYDISYISTTTTTTTPMSRISTDGGGGAPSVAPPAMQRQQQQRQQPQFMSNILYAVPTARALVSSAATLVSHFSWSKVALIFNRAAGTCGNVLETTLAILPANYHIGLVDVGGTDGMLDVAFAHLNNNNNGTNRDEIVDEILDALDRSSARIVLLCTKNDTLFLGRAKLKNMLTAAAYVFIRLRMFDDDDNDEQQLKKSFTPRELHNVWQVSPEQISNKSTSNFATNFVEHLNNDTDAATEGKQQRAAYVADAVQVYVHALLLAASTQVADSAAAAAANTQRKSFGQREMFEKMKAVTFQGGLSGKVAFDAQGERLRTIVLYGWRIGSQVVLMKSATVDNGDGSKSLVWYTEDGRPLQWNTPDGQALNDSATTANADVAADRLSGATVTLITLLSVAGGAVVLLILGLAILWHYGPPTIKLHYYFSKQTKIKTTWRIAFHELKFTVSGRADEISVSDASARSGAGSFPVVPSLLAPPPAAAAANTGSSTIEQLLGSNSLLTVAPGSRHEQAADFSQFARQSSPKQRRRNPPHRPHHLGSTTTSGPTPDFIITSATPSTAAAAAITKHDKLAVFRGELVRVHMLPLARVSVSAKLDRALTQCKDLCHENICRFIGMCPDESECCIVWEICEKGTLRDILNDEEISTDATVKLALANDILQGLMAIQHSPIRSHGQLSSLTCLLDKHFGVKITDFGMAPLKQFMHEFAAQQTRTQISTRKKSLGNGVKSVDNEPNATAQQHKRDTVNADERVRRRCEGRQTRRRHLLTERDTEEKEISTTSVSKMFSHHNMKRRRERAADVSDNNDDASGRKQQQNANFVEESPAAAITNSATSSGGGGGGGSNAARTSSTRKQQHDHDNCPYCFAGFASQRLWTAPELLLRKTVENLIKKISVSTNIIAPDSITTKNNVNMKVWQGTARGDIYSYGVVLWELTTRMEPYEFEISQGIHQDYESVLDALRAHLEPPLRPSVQTTTHLSSTDLQLLELARQCWADAPSARPTLAHVQTKLKIISGKRRLPNVTESLLARMENYSRDLEAIINERTMALMEEKQRIESILNELLPSSIAGQILDGTNVVAPQYFEQVTIYQSDIVGFTALAATCTPIQVTEILNALYTQLDLIIDSYGAYKVQTCGDAYVVASGLPMPCGMRHIIEIIQMALAIREALTTFEMPHKPNERVKIRVGIHTGPCAAGVVGLKMPRYSVFGDTITLAGVMEQRGAPNQIHVSEAAKNAYGNYMDVNPVTFKFVFELRGEQVLDNERKILTYWLLGQELNGN